MNSSESNDQRSRSSSDCSQTSNTSRCNQATPAQFRHQTQGGINSLHQGHQQSSQTSLNNQIHEQTNHLTHGLDANTSASTSHSQVAVVSSNTLHTGWPSQSLVTQSEYNPPNKKSAFPTSKSCNAISTSSGSESPSLSSTSISSCSSSPSSLSSSASSSLTSLSLQQQQQQQQTQAKYIHPAQITNSESHLACAKASTHASTASVSLSQSNAPSIQTFLLTPSLVHSNYSNSNTINSNSFLTKNSATGYPSVTSTVATLVTCTSSSSTHHTQPKLISSQATINSKIELDTAPGSSSIVSHNSETHKMVGAAASSNESNASKNHSDSAKRNAVNQVMSGVPSNSSVGSSNFPTYNSQDHYGSQASSTPVLSEVSSSSNMQTINSKQNSKWSKISQVNSNDQCLIYDDSVNVKGSVTGDSSAVSEATNEIASATTATTMATMPSNVTSHVKTTKPISVSADRVLTTSIDKLTISDASTSSSDSLEYCWQSRMDSVKERLAAVVNKETLADVYFLVGSPGKCVKFPAHKFVLSIGSPVFDAMFNRSSDRIYDKPIELPDCEPCAFLALLNFLYTDEVIVDAYSVMSTLYIAKKYGVSKLEKQCIAFLRMNLAPNNSIVLLSQARIFDELDLAQTCLKCIDESTVESLSSEGFTDIDRDTLKVILERDSLVIPEVILWKCVLSWARAECQRKELEASPENLREVLGPVLELVRFPLMSIEEFASEVAQTGVLLDRQIIDMFLYFTVNPKPQLPFSSESRSQVSGKERVVQRFQKVEYRWGYSGTSDRIKFQVNRRIWLVGFGLFGAVHGSSEYDVYMQVLLSSGEVLASNETCFTCDGSTRTFRVNFKTPVEIQPNVSHTACATMKGVDSYYGANGTAKVSVEVENKSRVTFTFQYSSGCNNGTSVEDGQIPELYFYT